LPSRAVVHRNDVLQVVAPGTGEPFDQMQVLARSLIVRFRCEVGHVDDQRIAFPVTSGVAMPLPDLLRNMRGSSDRNDALPPFIEDRYGARRLNDLLNA